MANGYCPALLTHIESIAANNSPAKKVSPSGFTAMLLTMQNSLVSPINDGFQANGHRKDMTVKYRKRAVTADVQTNDNCDVDRIPVYNEWTLPSLVHRQTSFFLSDEEIQKYCDDASRSVSSGAPATSFMQEHYSLIVESVNALLRSMNSALVTTMATKFGENVTIGSALGKVININRKGDQLQLNDGMITLLQDLRENEIYDGVSIVGGGLMSAYDLSRAALSANQSGMNIGALGLPRFFFDKDTQSIWGTDAIGVFAPGSVKLLNRQRYVGAFAGQKGTSFFFTLPLPLGGLVNPNDGIQNIVLDVQVKYIDCPTEVNVNGTPTTVNRGWQVILSKTFALWAQPTTGFETGDDLENTNGTLKYFVTNDCADCTGEAYAYGG